MERRVVGLSFCVERRYSSNQIEVDILFSAKRNVIAALYAVNTVMDRRGILVTYIGRSQW